MPQIYTLGVHRQTVFPITTFTKRAMPEDFVVDLVPVIEALLMDVLAAASHADATLVSQPLE